METRVEIIKNEIKGICNIEINDVKNEINVFTKNSFIPASRLVELMARTAAKDIEVGLRYDRKDGFVYTFEF